MKGTDEEEGIYGVRTGRVLSMGASVFVEFGYTILFACGCIHQLKKSLKSLPLGF